MKRKTSLGRILSGSIASWITIFITLFSQILLVPIFLSNWDAETYGIWLLLITFLGLTSLFNLSLMDYVGYECLKLGDKKSDDITKMVSSTSLMLFLSSLILFILVYLFTILNTNYNFFNINLENIKLWNDSVIVLFIAYIFTTSQSGLIERWLAPFGYFSFYTWLNTFRTLATSISPAIAVIYEANIFQASLVLVFTDISFHIVLYYFTYKIFHKEKLKLSKPNLKDGMTYRIVSLSILLRYVIDMSRQHGTRLVLAPLSSPSIIASFSTIRTTTNIIQQGLLTIIRPILPELMKYLVEKDKENIENTLLIILFAICFILSPSCIILQVIMPDIFFMWTNGKIEFDPLLFAFLVSSILFYAIGQPFDSILRGNNLIKPQLVISIIGGCIVIFGIIFTLPIMGIIGAGISLLISEIIVSFLCFYTVKKWLLVNNVKLEFKLFKITLLSIIVTIIEIFILNYSNTYFTFIIIVTSQIFIMILFYINIPSYIKSKFLEIIKLKRKTLNE